MANAKPLDPHQRELVNIVKAAHRTLGLARSTKQAEQERRLQEAKFKAARDWEKIEFAIRDDMDREITAHASNLDEALIAAYNAGIPMLQIAREGFGLQFAGTVQQKIVKLRNDGRVGNRVGYHPNEPNTEVVFPEPVDVTAVLAEATEIEPPVFKRWSTEDEPYVIIPATATEDAITTTNAVMVTMDARDPYFRTIQDQASFSANRDPRPVILYLNPYNADELVAAEYSLDPTQRWMNPVAFWLAEHPAEARMGFDAAISLPSL